MKTITLTEDQWEKILDAAQSYQDQGPSPNGWQTPELAAASKALDAALKEDADPRQNDQVDARRPQTPNQTGG